MSLYLELSTLSAAEEAKSAAEDAREESEYLASLVSSASYERNVESLNKMFQDIFYDREVDYFKVDTLKRWIEGKQNYRFTEQKPSYSYNFPLFWIFMFGISTFLFYPHFLVNDIDGVQMFLAGFAVLSAFMIIKKHYDALEWYLNKEYLLKLHNQKMLKIYEEPMKVLKSEFSMLNFSGLYKKCIIDEYLQKSYNILSKKDNQKAKEALLEIYYIFFNLDSEFSKKEEWEIVEIFLDRDELKELIRNNKLFTKESLEVYENL